ncbi:Wzz/FepE/Etk N-terminal domain-containing protein [Prevotella melaninogenica]|uniref:Wzz/FepE/Etk N-terminal domain-containing protein n=1 Tax=Prevotella melaninogenica TaxID=28132 RepID=UPI001C5DFC16|nr:Wzz/FepE/Etk N-terminal domain-containing protein [Prevotella melaninogenica]MBW4901153.1 chain-length determining protein [Prevotella melaninogenica]
MNIFDLKRRWIAFQEKKKGKSKNNNQAKLNQKEEINSDKTSTVSSSSTDNIMNENVQKEPCNKDSKATNTHNVVRKSTIAFNVIGLFRAMKKDWWIPASTSIIFAILGIWVAFQIPKIYKANVKLAPETNTNNLLSGVSSLASMVGLYNDANPNGDAIYPEIYPVLMSSNDFIIGILSVPVETLDKSIHTTYYDYLKKHQKQTWWAKQTSKINKYFTKKFGDKNTTIRTDSTKINPFELTKDQFTIVNSVKENISCSVDKKTNVIDIEVTSQDPLVSATIADSVKQRLQIYITHYRTSKARNDLKYMENLYTEAKKNYENARKKYALFCDENTDVILESVKSKQEDLENDMQLKYNIYTQLVQQLEMAHAKLQERVPAFTVVQSATVPIKHANIPKLYILITFLLLGWLLAVAILIIRHRQEIIIINE